MTHGGKRIGAGAPRKTPSKIASKLITIKVTPKQRTQFLALGGSKWVKRLIDESKQ